MIAPPIPAPMPYYEIELVGGDTKGLRSTLPMLLLHIGHVLRKATEESYTMVLNELHRQRFKNATGNIERAVRYVWDDDKVEGTVFVDPVVAPYAKYIEKGVKKHTMTYLLNSKGPIPVPVSSGKKSGVLYRVATEKWMGRPHLVEQPAWLGGGMYMTKGWIHPGYEGRWFFRQGIVAGIKSTQDNLKKKWVFRVIESGVEKDV